MITQIDSSLLTNHLFILLMVFLSICGYFSIKAQTKRLHHRTRAYAKLCNDWLKSGGEGEPPTPTAEELDRVILDEVSEQ